MPRKIKRRRRVFRVVCDALAYEDEDGDDFFPRVGQWVEFKRKMSGNDYAALWRFAELSDSDDTEELFRAIPGMVKFVAKKVIAWNWTDLDAEPDDDGNYPPLPPPTEESIGDLDFETDLVHLIEMLMGATEAPKNESGPS